MVGADGTQIAILGQVKTDVLVAGETFVQSMMIVKALATEGILGMDFLKDNECTINVGEGLLHITSKGITLPLRCPSVSGGDGKVGVCLKQVIQVPAMSDMEVLEVSPKQLGTHTWLLEGVVSRRLPAMAARAVVSPE